jgi:hypothetical protein
MRSLLAALCLLLALPAAAEVVVEGVLDGQPVRLVGNGTLRTAEVIVDGRRLVVDLDAGTVTADGRALALAAAPPSARYRIERIGNRSLGPRVAGRAGDYHMLRVDGRICAEVLVDRRWDRRADNAARILALLERALPGLRRPDGHGCGVIPFSALAGAGWPLLAGLRDRVAFETRHIALD